MNISRRKFLRGAAVAVPAAAVAVPLAVKAVEAKVVEAETPFELTEENFFTHTIDGKPECNFANPIEEDITYAFARVDSPECILWCEEREDGTFWVINGHWIYNPADPQWPENTVVWKGVAPFEHDEYNEAINWIRDQIVT